MNVRPSIHLVCLTWATVCLICLTLGCATDQNPARADVQSIAQSREAQNGAKAFQKFLSASDVIISQDPVIRDRVMRVFVRIVQAAKASSSYGTVASPLQWEHVVIRDDLKVTGFAFPGGKIGLYTGLISAADTDDQLAGAIGHLVAKVLTRHSAERISRNFVRAAGEGSGFGLRVKPPKGEELEKSWQATQRDEADYVGMLLSAEAGYDPHGSLALYKSLEGPASPRAKKLEEHLPEAMARYHAQQKATAPLHSR